MLAPLDSSTRLDDESNEAHEIRELRIALRTSRHRLRRSALQSTRQLLALEAEVLRLQALCDGQSLQIERHAAAAVAAIADAAACRQRSDRLRAENARLREFARYAEETIEALAKEGDALPLTLAQADLSGKRVLCVGGRPASLGSYRLLVEQSGGQFLHHDGDLGHGRQRIDDIVAAADLVICQTGCVSHNAHWRVQEHCKRNGKPCVFVANSGVASCGRAIGELGQGEARSQPESGEPD